MMVSSWPSVSLQLSEEASRALFFVNGNATIEIFTKCEILEVDGPAKCQP